MSRPPAHLSLVTLGVTDLARSIAFYEALGFRRKARAAEGVGFFEAGGCALAVWPAADMAKDAGIGFDGKNPAFRGVSLAWNCRSKADVNAALETAGEAGATIIKPASDAFWGGYLGYFADPDGHLWEVAHNPGFPLADDGRLTLPD